MRAAHLLEQIAISHTPAYDLASAEPTLLNSLADKRPEVAEAAASVLSLMDSKSAQPAILSKALDDKTGDDVKASFYKSLAVSARSFGNRIDQTGVDSLQKVIEGTASPDVRTAAAQYRGALNLPTDEAKQLIIPAIIRETFRETIETRDGTAEPCRLSRFNLLQLPRMSLKHIDMESAMRRLADRRIEEAMRRREVRQSSRPRPADRTRARPH